jgi:hypothetical protein
MGSNGRCASCELKLSLPAHCEADSLTLLSRDLVSSLVALNTTIVTPRVKRTQN